MKNGTYALCSALLNNQGRREQIEAAPSCQDPNGLERIHQAQTPG
jgi:hypothetical protein